MANTAPTLAGRAAGPLMLPPCRYHIRAAKALAISEPIAIFYTGYRKS